MDQDQGLKPCYLATTLKAQGIHKKRRSIHLPDAQSGWFFWHLLQSQLETLSHHLERHCSQKDEECIKGWQLHLVEFGRPPTIPTQFL